MLRERAARSLAADTCAGGAGRLHEIEIGVRESAPDSSIGVRESAPDSSMHRGECAFVLQAQRLCVQGLGGRTRAGVLPTYSDSPLTSAAACGDEVRCAAFFFHFF